MIFTLFEELLSRIEQMRNSITINRLHPKVNQSFQKKTDELLKNIKFQINDLLRSEDRFLPLTNQNFYSQYRSICEKLLEIEHNHVQVLKKFGESELYFSNLIKSVIQDEFKITISTPMVTTIRSNKDYFWADIGYELIGIPGGEEWHLTSLPDLVHEISHFIIAYDTPNYWITGNIRTVIADFFDKEFIEVQDNKRRPQILLTLLPRWKSYWESTWLTEFACDMLAIYFVGPAYAWTNLKISAAELPNDIYTFEKDSHPSHEARMRAMNEMLIIMGMQSDIAPINKAWKDLLSLPAYKKPDNYGFAFPDSLLQHLAYNIYQGCQNQGYLSYPEQLRKIEMPLSALMNEAWGILLNNSATYQPWEKERISTLHRRFNYCDINGQNT